MISKAKELFKKFGPLLQELETYVNYRNLIVNSVKRVERDYNDRKLSFSQYQKALNKYLQGKSLKDIVSVYDNYIDYIKRRVRVLNSAILKEVYEDSSKIAAPVKQVIPEFDKYRKEVKVKKIEPEPLKKEVVSSGTIVESEKEEMFFQPKKKEEIKPEEVSESIAGIELPKNVKRRLAERTFIGKKTEIPESLVEFETLHKRYHKEEGKAKIDPEILEREAKRIVSVSSVPKVAEKAYRPSTLGSVANLFVRKIGYFLIKKYPELFEKLYTGLRLANIGTLSNTYVNIIIFVTIVAFFVSFGLFFLFFLFTTYSFGEWIVKTFAMSLLIALVSLAFTYYYPFMKINQRIKNIDANLPFAINHMSAIASSGLPPDMMLRLVSQTREYGEISVELTKIVDYVDLFGYDVITAIDTVATNTPNQSLKDVLEGMITAVESGGDLKNYFTEKTEEIMSSYKLEKEKNIKTISTYSDIYTGIMVSAPLFFVSVLALVSILGGTIAGVSVQIVISVGTYLVVPLLNIGFLMFLSMAQPEI